MFKSNTYNVEIHGDNREHWLIVHFAPTFESAMETIEIIRAKPSEWSNPNRLRITYADAVKHQEAL
jgi:hypothetical protein